VRADLLAAPPLRGGRVFNVRIDGDERASNIVTAKRRRIQASPKFQFIISERFTMARKKNRDIAWERAATIRGKNPRAWRRDDRGNRIRYGSFETRGKYAWALQRGKPVSIAHHA